MRSFFESKFSRSGTLPAFFQTGPEGAEEKRPKNDAPIKPLRSSVGTMKVSRLPAALLFQGQAFSALAAPDH